MSRCFSKSCFNEWILRNSRFNLILLILLTFSIFLLSKEILKTFLGRLFFLNEGVWLSIMSNEINYHLVHRELLTSLRLFL